MLKMHLMTRYRCKCLAFLTPVVLKPQWGTKVLRYFYKMAPFWTVDIPIPSPCVPHPLPPKSMLYFRPSSLSFATDSIYSGVEGFRAFKYSEIMNEWMKLLVGAPVLDRCVSCFCPWLWIALPNGNIAINDLTSPLMGLLWNNEKMI